jgi:hypothetical protein
MKEEAQGFPWGSIGFPLHPKAKGAGILGKCICLFSEIANVNQCRLFKVDPRGILYMFL